MKKILSFIFCCLFFSLTAFNQNAKTSISLNLKKGETYYHSSVVKLTVSQKIQDKETKTYMTLKGKMSFKVIAFTDSVYELETKYVSMSIAMRALDKATEFSSESKDTTDMFSQMLKTMTDQPFTVLMLQTGKVNAVKNIEGLFAKILDNFPTISVQNKAELMAKIRQSYGGEAFTGSIESITNIFPAKEISVGDKWIINSQLQSNGILMRIETNYVLKQLTSDFAVITGAATVISPDKDSYTETSGMQVRYDLTGTIKSNIKVNLSTGWIIESNVDQNIKGNAEIKDGPKTPGGMIIPMTLISDMKVEGK